MTKEQILKKVIEKAVKNGYSGKIFKLLLDRIDEFIEWMIEKEWVEQLIFDHDFAKALWGERECKGNSKGGISPIPIEVASDSPSGVMMWQHHLQQLAIAEDRIKYLSKFT